jgi:CHAT domain-containing protein
MWEDIAEPVLTFLGYTSTPSATDPWPRLWWMPTGAATRLPLHAAGDHHAEPMGAGPTVLDRVVSSYAPTLSALLSSRKRSRSRPLGDKVLGVAMPATEGRAPLRRAPAEVRRVAELLGGQAVVLTDEDATTEEVMRHLEDAAYAHFACHADSVPLDPGASHLLLKSGKLTLRQISSRRLNSAHLAYLSACTTARGGVKLADEAIHISSAFQVSGFANVIGTLWPIGDYQAKIVADLIYEHLARDRTDVARAVHNAIRTLRRSDLHLANPLTWASHIHIGP